MNILKIFFYIIYKFIPNNLKNNLRIIYNSYSGIYTISNLGKKRALIIYLKTPFQRENKVISHCNILESFAIKDELIDRNYSLDVIDYRCKRKIDYSKYDLIFGFGDVFSKSFNAKNTKKNLKRICYSTGAYPNIMNSSEKKRLDYFNKKNKSTLRPQRYWDWDKSSFSFENSDCIIHTGNSWTLSTFNEINFNMIFTLPVPSITSFHEKDLDKNNVGKDYIFFSGSGAVFKGLDLVIDAFKSINTDSNLYIYGPFDAEEDFMKIYEPVINNSTNIFFNGTIDPMSDEFSKIVSSCSFTILPSCSEAGASSVITTMHKGLIPIVTKEASIDLHDFGFLIKDLSVESVKKALLMSMQISNIEITKQKKQIVKFIEEKHTLIAYKSELKNALDYVL